MMKRFAVLAIVVLSILSVAAVASAERDNIGGVGTKSVKGGITTQEHNNPGGGVGWK